MKLLPLQGYKSLTAMRAFFTLMLGLNMLPRYFQSEFQEFMDGFKAYDENEKERKIREAAALVQLTPDEVAACVSFATDKNGVAYTDINVGNLKPDELFEIIVAVCMQIGRIEIGLVSKDEKKKSETTL